jgi:hypothetical protein
MKALERRAGRGLRYGLTFEILRLEFASQSRSRSRSSSLSPGAGKPASGQPRRAKAPHRHAAPPAPPR